jgi:hypothetical protein
MNRLNYVAFWPRPYENSTASSALRNILMKLRIMKIDRAADVRSNAALEN